jgi:hypothetical protein
MAARLFKWLLFSIVCFIALTPLKAASSCFSRGPQPGLHPFYIAVTEIEHNAREKSLEISCKIFAEDFEEILKKNYGTVVDLGAEKDKAALDKYIPDYIGHHLKLRIDGKPVNLGFVGFERDRESAYCYFQVDNISSVKKMEVQNSLLHDFTDKQINIVHVVVEGKRQSTKLDYPSSLASFNF